MTLILPDYLSSARPQMSIAKGNREVRRTRVVYVLGSYRSGTTLLSNLLGQLDGFFCAGELRSVWRGLNDPDRLCGCGAPLVACPVWREILGAGFGANDEHALRALGRQNHDLLDRSLHARHRWRRVPRLLRTSAADLTSDEPIGRYAGVLGETYRAIQRATGAEVVVDSSKEAGDAALVELLPDVEAYFVHIVRDPRGTIYSRLRLDADGSVPTGSHARTTAYTASSWLVNNIASAAVRRRAACGVFLRYEDFVRDPVGTVEGLSALVGVPRRLAVAESGDPFMAPTHTVDGNDNRFRTGVTHVATDLEWIGHLNALDRAISSVVCLPLLAGYGYVVRPRADRPFLPAPRRMPAGSVGVSRQTRPEST
jgi:hypothetical protein